MTKRKLAAYLAVPALAGVFVILALTVLHTTAGARWLLSSVESRIAGSLEMAQMDGDLSSGLTINNLVYRDTGNALNAERIHIALDLDFFPFIVRVSRADIRAVEVRQLKDQQGSSSLDDALSSLALPVTIELENLLLDQVTVINPAGDTVFSADRISTSLGLRDVLRIDRLLVEKGQQHVSLNGKLDLTAPFAIESRADARLAFESEPGVPQQKFDIHLQIEGQLQNQLRVALSAEDPVLTINGTLQDIAGEAEWQLHIESPEMQWPPDQSVEAEFMIQALSADTQGWIDRFDLSANGNFTAPDLGTLQFILLATGDEAGLSVANLDLTGPELDLSASGELRWQDALEISLSSTLNRIDPGAWVTGWPDAHPLAGRVDFQLREAGLDLSRIELEATGTSMNLKGSGRVELPDGAVAADLSWKNFGWPVGSADQDFASPEGNIHLTGVVDDWKIHGEAAIHPTGLPEGTLQLAARGNRERVSMTIEDGRILGGVVTGEAEYDWSENGQWRASLNSREIQTAGIFPDWPAKFSADVVAEGSIEPFELVANIKQLNGELRTVPVTASGRLLISEGQPAFDELNLKFGNSVIELQGSPSGTEGLAFLAQIENLASIFPQSEGSLQTSGHLSLQTDTPRLLLDLEGKNLAWQGYRAQSISIHDSPNRAPDAMTDLHLEAAHLQLNEHSLDSVSLDLRAGKEDQSLSLAAQHLGLALFVEATGSFLQFGESMFASGWVGEITALTLAEKDRLSLSLQKPAPLEWSSNSIEIEGACVGAAAGSSLCIDGEWQRNERFSTAARLTRMPLSLVQPFLDIDLESTHTIDGEMDWSSVMDGSPSGKAMFKLSPGEVGYPDESESLIKTGEGRLEFVLAEGKLSAGKFYVPLPGVGEIDLDLGIPDVSAGLDAGMNGHLNIALSDLDILTLLIPVIDQAGGHFSANIDLAGNLAQPKFSGQLTLTDGLIHHDGSGLRLNDIQLSGRIINNSEAVLGGSFRSLEGSGQLEAALDLSNILSPGLDISIKGKELKLFDTSDLTLVAEPDIQIGWQDGAVEIDGSLLIPSARIAPEYIPSSTVSESPDLVIVAGELPGAHEKEQPSKKITIRGELDLTLGDDVALDLEHASAKLTGAVNFAWQDELLPIANGQYSLVGQIQALGQRLEISEGTIGFPGVPADNPHLNIRAERQIFGNSEIRRAGIFVSGTLRRLVMEPYTEPATNRERARTLLITGSDFNMERGVGAVDIGTYIAPRVFVSYGIGVFEDENVVSVRYDLGRGWGIKATSGQRQTGFDLSYIIER